MPISGEIINSPATKEYMVARLSKDNLADVIRLHLAVYGIGSPVDYFPGKYNTAYTGVEWVGFIAYNRDKLAVAYYGVIPCFIQDGDQTILAAQSADTMTHPEHRFKGMFVELSNMAFDLCRELGILLVFGFPNQHSYHGAINKLGWKMTGTMSYFMIPVRSLPLESVSKKVNFIHKLYKRYTGFLLNRKKLPQHAVANSVLTDGFAGIWRGGDYGQYKMYNTTEVISIDKAKVWISRKHGLMIGDIEGITESNFDSVINRLKRMSKMMGIRQLQFHCSPGTGLHDLFAKRYEAHLSYPMLFQDFGSPIPPERIRFTFADIDIF